MLYRQSNFGLCSPWHVDSLVLQYSGCARRRRREGRAGVRSKGREGKAGGEGARGGGRRRRGDAGSTSPGRTGRRRCCRGRRACGLHRWPVVVIWVWDAVLVVREQQLTVPVLLSQLSTRLAHTGTTQSRQYAAPRSARTSRWGRPCSSLRLWLFSLAYQPRSHGWKPGVDAGGSPSLPTPRPASARTGTAAAAPGSAAAAAAAPATPYRAAAAPAAAGSAALGGGHGDGGGEGSGGGGGGGGDGGGGGGGG